MCIFEADPSFKELVSFVTRQLDNERILQIVARIVGYIMFSDARQGNEPSFQDVNVVKPLRNPANMPSSEESQNLSNGTHRLGYKWMWSDTCCIDKATGLIPDQSSIVGSNPFDLPILQLDVYLPYIILPIRALNI